MSGHSKWAQIKRQKGVADNKRGEAFTKIANAITIAVRQGGSVDPAQNFRLRLAIEKARQINMPKENIRRAMNRAQGKESGGLEEVVYEGFGPGKVGIIVEATTDNKQRTSSEIRNLFEKGGGVMAHSGSVSYQFEQKGVISLKKEGITTQEAVLEKAAEAGAEDIEEAGKEILVYTKPEDVNKIGSTLGQFGACNIELILKPLVTIRVSDRETARRLLNLIQLLEENDDVQKVYANFDIPDEYMTSLNE